MIICRIRVITQHIFSAVILYCSAAIKRFVALSVHSEVNLSWSQVELVGSPGLPMSPLAILLYVMRA